MTKPTVFHFFLAFIILFLVVIYKGVIFENKIALPTNYLAHFYSPWATQKFPGWEQGIPNKPLGTDLLRFFYPQHESGLYLWNPYIFSGNPVMANFQSAIFYPLTHLPWNFLIIIPPLLASLFCFLYLKSLNLSIKAQLFGAFAFGLSGFLVCWSQEAVAVAHSAIWLPLIFYGIETKKKLILIFALTMCILAGYLQISFYIFALAFFYSLYKKSLKLFIVSCLLSFGITAIQLLPSFEAFKESVRPMVKIDGIFAKYLLSPFQLVKTIAPDITGHPGSYNYFSVGSYNETILYIGVIPLIFAIYGFTKSRFFAVSAIVTFIFTSNLPLINDVLSFLPLVSTFQPSRILILTTFCLSVLAAYGIESYSKKIRFIPIILGVFLLLTLIYYKLTLILPRDFLVALKNSILPFGFLAIFFILTFIKSKKIFLILIFIFTIFGQYYFFNRYLSLGEKQFLYPQHEVFSYVQNNQTNYERFIALDKPIFGNFATIMKVYSPEGFDPIFSKRYGELVMAAKNDKELQRIEVTLSEPIATNSARVKKLLNLVGVKNILRFQNNQWLMTKNEAALPRAFLVNNYIVETDDKKLLEKIFDPNIDLLKTVILEEEPRHSGKAEGRVQNPSVDSGVAPLPRMTIYAPTNIVINTNFQKEGLLFLSDNYYPGWKAFVNGEETKIYRADYSFRAVSVPAGENTVIFKYDPLSLKIGVIITLISLCGLAFFYLARYLLH